MIRCGIGYDAHRLVAERKLILGGVEIPHDRGLEGHSDADVLSHAIADALLGAMGKGDIGHHFPDTDESIRGISSLEILRHVRELLAVYQARLLAARAKRMTSIMARTSADSTINIAKNAVSPAPLMTV